MQDDVQTTDPVDISLNQLELNEVRDKLTFAVTMLLTTLCQAEVIFVKFDVVLNVTDSDFWCRTLSQLMWFHSFGKFLHLFCFRCVKILVFLFLLTKKEFCFYMYFAQCRLQRCDCLTGVLWTGSARPAGSQGSVAGWDFRYAESSSLHRRGST